MSSALCLIMVLSLSVTALAAGQFKDVKSGDYFAAPVEWAVMLGITNGTGTDTFSPNDICTRAQILTFLWRAAGKPESTAFRSSPYMDVEETDYFYQAALWATERGIIAIEDVNFEPKTPCTRAATVEYLWRFSGSPDMGTLPFSDLGSDANLQKAVAWAVTNGITNGTGGTTFSPQQTCTRAQIVTFLYRNFAQALDNTKFIADLKAAAGGSGSSSGSSSSGSSNADMKLDPLPPDNYRKHADWYLTLTDRTTLSNDRLAAEHRQISTLIDEWREKEIFITDSVYAREFELSVEISDRMRVYQQYEREVSWKEVKPSTLAKYNELVDKYGDFQTLADYYN